MADIELVVKIEEERYNQIKRCADNYLVSGLELAVKNGIPLPKGHGKLIAEPTEEIIKKLKDVRNEYPTTYSDKIYDAVTIDEGIAEVTDFGIGKGLEMAILIIEANSESVRLFAENIIRFSPTIIEADRSDKE